MITKKCADYSPVNDRVQRLNLKPVSNPGVLRDMEPYKTRPHLLHLNEPLEPKEIDYTTGVAVNRYDTWWPSVWRGAFGRNNNTVEQNEKAADQYLRNRWASRKSMYPYWGVQPTDEFMTPGIHAIDPYRAYKEYIPQVQEPLNRALNHYARRSSQYIDKARLGFAHVYEPGVQGVETPPMEENRHSIDSINPEADYHEMAHYLTHPLSFEADGYGHLRKRDLATLKGRSVQPGDHPYGYYTGQFIEQIGAANQLKQWAWNTQNRLDSTRDNSLKSLMNAGVVKRLPDGSYSQVKPITGAGIVDTFSNMEGNASGVADFVDNYNLTKGLGAYAPKYPVPQVNSPRSWNAVGHQMDQQRFLNQENARSRLNWASDKTHEQAINTKPLRAAYRAPTRVV